MEIYQDAMAHFVSGITLSFGDRLFSDNAKRHTAARKEAKLEDVTSLEYLSREDADLSSPEYASAIRNARHYFESIGVDTAAREEGNWLQRLPNKIRGYKSTERLNNLSLRDKFVAAFGIEFTGDLISATTQMISGDGTGIASVGRSLYQGPALFAGLVAGRGILYVKDAFFRDAEEKELDAMAQELTSDGSLLEKVRAYRPQAQPKPEVHVTAESTPSEETAEDTPSFAEKVTDFAEDMTDNVTGIYAGIRAKIQSRAKRKAAEELDKKNKRRKALKSKYEGY